LGTGSRFDPYSNAYTEILPDEEKESTTAFLIRALCWFERNGVTIVRVVTDDGENRSRPIIVTTAP
jgi:hypothetical protein